MSIKRWAFVLAALPVVFALGCSTYVNIPAQQSDVARHDPNQETVVQVETAALKAVLADRPVTGPFQIILPLGTDQVSYEQVAIALGKSAFWALNGQPREGAYALEARQVRVRGWFAEVDVVRPIRLDQAEGLRQLVTVYEQWDPVNHWYIQRLRVWGIPVEEALRASQRESEVGENK